MLEAVFRVTFHRLNDFHAERPDSPIRAVQVAEGKRDVIQVGALRIPQCAVRPVTIVWAKALQS